MKLVGNGCEKAKHHLNPSSGKPKNGAFATLPHGAETAPSKPLKERQVKDRSRWANRWAKNVAQPNLDKDKNEARRQRMRKGQTPPKCELRQAKNNAFATLPHGAETAPSKPLKERQVKDRSRWAKNVAQPNLHRDKNEARWQRMRKGQTPPKSELRQAKKRYVRNPSTGCRKGTFETFKGKEVDERQKWSSSATDAKTLNTTEEHARCGYMDGMYRKCHGWTNHARAGQRCGSVMLDLATRAMLRASLAPPPQARQRGRRIA